PKSEEKALPQRAQRSTEEETGEDFTAKGAEVAEEETAESFTSEVGENAEEESQGKGEVAVVEGSFEPQNAEVNSGVESAKSIFFGVEVGEGVADNHPVTPPSEPARKSGQKEILMVP
ncbi:MAG TPA: hypothetical protein VH724_10225, partial [Candidatus Angelobacter sp.]|nr:hypothetical protein [Candidatus Angelobacter sp.]